MIVEHYSILVCSHDPSEYPGQVQLILQPDTGAIFYKYFKWPHDKDIRGQGCIRKRVEDPMDTEVVKQIACRFAQPDTPTYDKVHVDITYALFNLNNIYRRVLNES